MTRYKQFKIGDLFFITTGRDVIIGNTQSGTIPLISHQHENNGITKYIKKLNHRKLFHYKDTIALADRGVFYATTQKEDFQIGTRVKALTFKSGEKSEAVRLFFVTAINKLQVLFTEYLDNATDKLPNLTIQLPVNEKDEIDYPFMEKYISQLEQEYLTSFDHYLIQNDLVNCELSSSEKIVQKQFMNGEQRYLKFKLKDLFESQNGDTDIQQKHINGRGYYVVSSGEYHNGIIGKSDIKSKVFSKNTITIDMFGYAFFRDYEYKMVTHARVFSLKYKEKELSIEEGLYILTQFHYFKKLFSYSDMASWKKIKDIFIELPVDSFGNIDYDFMRNFIRIQEKLAIKGLDILKENP